MGESVRALIVLVVAVFIVHGGALDDPFHYDDHHSLVNNSAARDLGNAVGFFGNPQLFSESPTRAMYRPLVLLSYAVNAAVAGDGPAGFHVVNLILHALSGWMLWLLARAMFSVSAGWVAGLLFVLHPLAAEPAIYISARSESLALIFALWSVLAFRRERGALSAAMFALALLAKSTAIVTPAVIFCLDRAAPGNQRRRTRLARWTPFLVVVLAYVLGTGRLIGRSLGAGRPRGPGEQFWVTLEAWAYQLRLFVVPHPLSVEHPLPASPSAGPVDVLVLMAGLSLVAVIAAASPKRVIWLCLAAILPLLPPSVIPLNAVVSEHRLYSTVALASLAVSGASVWVGGWRRAGIRVLLVLLLFFAGLDRRRDQAWSAEIRLWRSAIEVAPQNARAQFFLADVYRRQGQAEPALKAFARADSLSGGATDIRLSHAAQLLDLGRTAEARELLEPLLAQSPGEPALFYNLGLAGKEIDPGRAEGLFQQALTLRPDLRDGAMELALLQDARGASGQAGRTLESSLHQSPVWVEAWVNLGFFRIRDGDARGARVAWTRALELSPELQVVRDNIRALDSLEAAGAARR